MVSNAPSRFDLLIIGVTAPHPGPLPNGEREKSKGKCFAVEFPKLGESEQFSLLGAKKADDVREGVSRRA